MQRAGAHVAASTLAIIVRSARRRAEFCRHSRVERRDTARCRAQGGLTMMGRKGWAFAIFVASLLALGATAPAKHPDVAPAPRPAVGTVRFVDRGGALQFTTVSDDARAFLPTDHLLGY